MIFFLYLSRFLLRKYFICIQMFRTYNGECLIHCAKSDSNMVVWYIWFLLISPPVNHSDSILNISLGFKSV